jgi:KUP system potassium uptake protein
MLACGVRICEKILDCATWSWNKTEIARDINRVQSRGGEMTAENAPHGEKSGLAATALAAMGVVFGDIGTSPLYTMKEVFGGHHPLAVNPDNVLGILSLVFWALTITVSLKYVLFITRADNKGEGGIMALTALALRTANASPRVLWMMSALGIFGAALFYGDAVITPAMSVLSAVEGLEVATPLLKPYVLPITVAILVVLFVFQRHGTAAVGALFGPVMMFWFATLGALGLWNVIQYPSVLAAINPWYALSFGIEHQGMAFLALGSVVLAITGGEALYADMGHFGRRAIKWAWFALCLSAALSQLPWPGSADPQRPEGDREPVLPARAERDPADPAGHPGHRRHRDRLAGGDFRRLFAHQPGHAAGLLSAHPGSTSPRSGKRDRFTFRTSTGCCC